MNLTMVGTGYVGLVTGACFAGTGNRVVCLDIDAEKVATLSKGISPIYEPGLQELITANLAAGRLRFTTNRKEAYAHGEAIFICVGTPTDGNGCADLHSVFNVAEEIADAIDSSAGRDGAASAPPRLVVVKSTVPVGTTHRVRDLISSRTQARFHIANNPEFLKQGAAVADFMKPDRVVCGVEDECAAEIMRDLYEPFVRQGNPIFMMEVRSSEMVKYAANAMLACKISFINEIANLCEYYNADVRAVREGMCADQRIGNQFLHPGLGYGGSCFPKDTLAIVEMGKSVGFDCKLNAAVHEVNQDQRRYFWKKVIDHFGPDLTGRTLAFWGAAFKPLTDDVREAPSLTLMEHALAVGAQIRAYDPVAAGKLRQAQPRVAIAGDMYDALQGADALIICTEWNEFRQPDFDRIDRSLKSKVLFDGRNIYRPSQMRRLGFTYYSVGREPVGRPEKPGVKTAPAPRAG